MPPALLALAATGRDLVSFGPWVPAVDERGRVAFTAVHAGGRTGLHLVAESGPLGEWMLGVPAPRAAGAGPRGPGVFGAGQSAEGAASGGARADVAAFTSHPDLDRDGALYVYAALADGRDALVRAGPGAEIGPLVTAGPGQRISRIGPTGPTVNGAGVVALRTFGPGGEAGCHLWAGGALRDLAADTGAEGFEGLPVVNDRGEVALRARVGGRDRLFAGAPGALRGLGDGAAELGRFPCLAHDGAVGAPAYGAAGGGYRRWRGDEEEDLLPAGRFGFVRGGLLVAEGLLAVYVQTSRSPLAVLVGPDPERDLLVGVGQPLFGSEVLDLALNPVSGAEAGWIAVRVTLADGRGLVCRTAVPVTPWRA